MRNTHKAKKTLLERIANVSIIFVLLAIVALAVLSVIAMRELSFKTAVLMGEDKLKGDLASFKYMLSQEYGELQRRGNALVDSQGNSLENQFQVINKISEDLEIVATIFIKDSDHYRRITTSIKDSTGKRAVGTFLDTKSDAFESVKAGKEYVGKAVILGNNYLTLYHPFCQPNTDEVIGLLFLGIKMETIESIIGDSMNTQIIKTVIIAICILFGSILFNFLSRWIVAQKSDERTKAIFEAVPVGLTVWNRKFESLEVNQETLKMFDMPSKEEYVDRFYDLMPEFQPDGSPSRERAAEYINKAFEVGFLKVEWMHQKLNGEPVPTEVTLVRVEYRGEHAVTGLTRDLREQKAMLREMRRAEIAEETNKTKSKFLATMSHEIRTPMNIIMGVTEIQLQDEMLKPDIKESFAEIYNASTLLLSIINNILDLAKIEAGKMELVLVEYRIASLINDAAQLNMMQIKSKAIEFELQVDENLPSTLLGDELRIKQILNNLLSNAFKYTEAGKVKLEVSCLNQNGQNLQNDQNEIVLVFCVSDTGQGMTEEQVSRIFDEYSRHNLEANRAIEGTGLGMSIMQRLIHMMGGDIDIKSELGKGSVFTARLPQKVVGTGVIGKEMAENLRKFRISSLSSIKSMQIVRDPMPYGKVLVVDDVDSNLYVAKRLLAPYDLTIETANSGPAAIERINAGNVYDIVFMDHMMPKMDGMEAVKIIRDSGYKRTIVALTANAVIGQAELFLKNGFDDFISKPIDIRQLDAVLNKFIRNKQTQEVIDAARKSKNKATKSVKIAFEADDKWLAFFIKDAKKAVSVFESTLKNISEASNEDLNLFAINAHTMKSNLANMGEKEASKQAALLETAGKEQSKSIIMVEAPSFIKALKEIIAKTEPKINDSATINESATDSDPAYLQEQLQIICKACEEYNEEAATDALANLEKLSWTKETKAVLDKIAEHLLHSEFDEAVAMARK